MKKGGGADEIRRFSEGGAGLAMPHWSEYMNWPQTSTDK